MICGRRGAPDSMGRETLFFHALVADKVAMSDAKADISSLFSQGVFVDKMPSGDIATLCVDVGPKASQHAGSVMNVTAPCVIRSEKPLLDIVSTAVGDRALELSWATFAFQSMQCFDVQILPPRVPCPRTMNEYDATGKLIRSASKADSSRKEDTLQRHHDETAYSSAEQVPNVSSKDKSNAMLKLSVILNIVLVAVCALLLLSRKSATDAPIEPATPIVVTNTVEKIVEKRVLVELSDAQKAEIEGVAIRRFRAEQERKFPSVSKEAFLDFHNAATNLFDKYYGPDYYEQTKNNPDSFRKEHQFLSALEIGVNFVNKNLLKGKTQ